MHRTPISFALLLVGIMGFWSVVVPDADSEESRSPAAPTERLNPSQAPSPNIPLIRIVDLLASPDTFHEQLIVVRGTITRLELHVDESTLFIDYVFWLEDGEHRVLVFGRHDRTTGDIQMITDRAVEVRGLFWKKRFVNEYRLENNLEAHRVRFFPPVNADRA